MTKHFLVVDDCSINRLVIKLLLKKIDSECLLDDAKGGSQVVELIEKNNSYDIIWIDLHMPDMNGIECTKLLRTKYSYKGCIVGVSAYADDETKEECLKSGMDIMVPKPVSEQKIIKIIEKLNKQ